MDNYRNVPKADLHVHMTGAIPLEVISLLINNTANQDLEEVTIKEPVSAFEEYFKPWETINSLLIRFEYIDFAIKEMLKKMSLENVKYVELRTSIINLAKINGKSNEEIIDLLVFSVEKYSKIFDITGKIIVSISNPNEINQYTNILDYITTHYRENIVGFDLIHGKTTSDINVQSFFDKVENNGLGITIHANHPENIINAINKCHAKRIGHALNLFDSIKAVDLVIKKEICIEVCLSTSILTNSILTIDRHPIKNIIEYSIPFTICSDNPLLHQKCLSDEYTIFFKNVDSNYTPIDLYNNQMKYKFFN